MSEITELKTTADVLACIEAPFHPITRADIAKQLDLSRTTVSTAVANLIQLGLVQEQPLIQDQEATLGRGRPGIPLTLRADEWYAIGASFHTSTWRFVITDLTSRVVYQHSRKVSDLSVERFIAHLLDGLHHMIKQCPGRLLPLLGIGPPGMVDDNAGVILRAEDLGWHDIRLGDIVLAQTGISAAVLNRHRACALAEANVDIEKRSGTLIYLGIDTGIIAAAIINGNLLTGTNHCAGEIGHTIIDPHGAVCRCGKQGCLQAMASLTRLNAIIAEAYQDAPPQPDDVFFPYIRQGLFIPGEVIAEAAYNGHSHALRALREISKYLGLTIGNLINLLNPQTIILGGSLVTAHGDLLTRLVSEEVNQIAMTYPMSAVTILPSRLGIYSGAIGAASLPLGRKLELALNESAK